MRRLRAVAVVLGSALAMAAPSAPAPSLAARPALPSAAKQGALPLPSQSAGDLEVGRFLVANRSLGAPIFAMTVILLLEHSPQGSLGVIVNRRMEVALERMLPDVEGLAGRPDLAWFGGPVDVERMLFLIRSDEAPENAAPVLEGVYASGHRSTLRELLAAGDAEFRGYVGYAGWAPEQLEGEMARGDWYVAEADAAAVFSEDVEALWPELISRSEGIHVQGPRARRLSRYGATRSRNRPIWSK